MVDPLELNSHEGVLEMGEVCISSSMGEYSSREGLGVAEQETYSGFITPIWEVVSKMGGVCISSSMGEYSSSKNGEEGDHGDSLGWVDPSGNCSGTPSL